MRDHPLERRHNMVNKGRLNEDQIIHVLNADRFCDLPKNLQNLVVDLFGVVDPYKPVSCEYAIEYTKPDFVITHSDRKRYVSMKSGSSILMHGEQITTFIPFLRSLGISEKTINTILLHHYGDGTTDGSGKERMPINELKYHLYKQIKEANEELNSDRAVLIAFAERILFQGVRDDVPKADALYHGDYEFGVVATRKQILKHLSRGNWDFFDNLHIGPFMIYPHARYIGTEIHSEKSRNRVDVSWPKVISDIEYISKRYDNYTPIKHRTYEE